MTVSKLYNNKWLWRVVLVVGIAAGLFAEGNWLWGVQYGNDQPVISQWLKNNEALQCLVGSINSIEVQRLRSTYSCEFNNGANGRFHYHVEGSKSSLDVLVTWHKNGPNQPIIFDKIETYDDNEIIWSPLMY